MKKSLLIISALFFVLLIFNSCNKHQKQVELYQAQIIGEWEASIDSARCNSYSYGFFNNLNITFQEGSNIALYNLSIRDSTKWKTPQEHIWWIDYEKYPSLISDRLNEIRYNLSFSINRDTFVYEIEYINATEMKIRLNDVIYHNLDFPRTCEIFYLDNIDSGFFNSYSYKVLSKKK